MSDSEKQDYRIYIKDGYKKTSKLDKALAIFFIYIPLLVFTPFAILGVLAIRAHLYFLGAKNIKSYKDFLPSKDSYRYDIDTQIVTEGKFFPLAKSKIFWIFNCNYYCTYHVALLVYFAYLVKAIENWWCPFWHDKKDTYKDSKIDKSYWHTIGMQDKLHTEDRYNPIWNKDYKDKS